MKAPHPIVWTILYVPFGALSGFVQIALTFLGTKHGLSISETSLLNGANLLSQWLKWTWAPVVDITLTARRWYTISTTVSAIGVFAMCVIPLSPATLLLFLGVITIASLVNSIVGMAVEAIIAESTPPEQIGRVSAWLQVGNLAGSALGGALGLALLTHLPQPWMAGGIMAASFMACCLALRVTPAIEAKHHGKKALDAVKGVLADLRDMIKTKGGLLSAILCIVPAGTGAAQVVMTQSEVAKFWGAGEREVSLVQGLLSAGVVSAGCFVGGWLCTKWKPRNSYALFCVFLAAVASCFALAPASIPVYIGGSLVYSFGVGLCYSGFSAFVLDAMGHGSGATKYNVFASLSNFPIWWVGLVLGRAADKLGPPAMLHTEAALGVVGIALFFGAVALVRRSKLPEAVAELPA